MAFRFNWPEFDSEFYGEARSQLEAALNKGNKPKNIVDHISVTELNMGTTAPDLEILEIGELSTDKFRGIFKLTYCGDAYIVIQTKVQANPMHAKESDLPRHTRPSVLAADQPLIVPMLLRISDLKLRGIVVLVVSKTKGITLVFKNDPLESILVSSTFDSVTSVRSFLQREIENQLRNLFQEDLPVMIHNLSLRHIQSQQEKEFIKQQDLRKKSKLQSNIGSNRSVYSDPGIRQNGTTRSVYSDPGIRHNKTTVKNNDTFSMPDLSSSLPMNIMTPPLSFFDPLHTTQFSSFSDLYNNSIPVTAANLSQLNELYSSRFAALKTPPYSDYGGNSSKALKEEDDDYYVEEEEDDYLSRTSATNSFTAHEMYIDNDVDAPWYVTEGPELPSANNSDDKKTLTMMSMDEDIMLNPKENSIAAKLAQLTSINHTISPFIHTIEHSTFRSLPHTISSTKSSALKNTKKKPKRRIIRWNTTA